MGQQSAVSVYGRASLFSFLASLGAHIGTEVLQPPALSIGAFRLPVFSLLLLLPLISPFFSHALDLHKHVFRHPSRGEGPQD